MTTIACDAPEEQLALEAAIFIEVTRSSLRRSRDIEAAADTKRGTLAGSNDASISCQQLVGIGAPARSGGAGRWGHHARHHEGHSRARRSNDGLGRSTSSPDAEAIGVAAKR